MMKTGFPYASRLPRIHVVPCLSAQNESMVMTCDEPGIKPLLKLSLTSCTVRCPRKLRAQMRVPIDGGEYYSLVVIVDTAHEALGSWR